MSTALTVSQLANRVRHTTVPQRRGWRVLVPGLTATALPVVTAEARYEDSATITVLVNGREVQLSMDPATEVVIEVAN